ncbi:MAG: hypothetical protein P4L83_06290 [Nevskia sp.]|nr:hypothetical protein [Nevskia sp.]
MNLTHRIGLSLVLGAALTSVQVLADDAPAAPEAKAHHHHKHHAGGGAKKGAAHGVTYKGCLKEKMAVAEYFCNAHSDACKAEKDGAARECRGEARGERHKG